MIEVNLLPGGRKRSSGGGFSFSMPKLGGGGGGPSTDPYLLAAIGAGIVAFAVIAWLFLGIRSEREDVEVALAEAVQDSVRFADLISQQGELVARRDSILERIRVISEIDEGRYTWPHVLDEVARAMPEFTWLTELGELQPDPLQLRISGRAGSTFAITNFMRQLEASPFLRGVDMERSEQIQSEADPQDIVYVFDLVVSYESPPPELLTTELLFEDELSTQTAAPDSGGVN